MSKPLASMDRLTVPKAEAANAVPFARAPSPDLAPEPSPAAAAAAALSSGPKSLTVKLDASDYAALRERCIEQERATGRRVTHQEIMVSALRALLKRSIPR